MTLISKKIIYLSGDTSDVDQGFSRNKHTISYHVQSSLNFELDLKISWCHGLITRYLVPKKWWRTFPEYHKIWYWEKSFEINKNVKLVHVLRYISVQQRFFKICFQTALGLLVYVWRTLTFDHWTCYSSQFGCFVSNKMEVCLTKGDDLLVYTCSTSWPTNQLNNEQV